MLNLFIERVEIGERYSRTAAQSIDIYYRDIGLLYNFAGSEAISEQEPTPKEVA